MTEIEYGGGPKEQATTSENGFHLNMKSCAI